MVLADSECDQLEIYPSYVLLQKIYKEKELMVVGLASEMGSAKDLLVKMTEDCLRETGNVSLKEYFRT